ncbi:MAG: hypothetical protein V4584_17700 [Verrucomicrobiota bacterium]
MARERALRAKQPGYHPLEEKLADWTDGELIAALNASLTDPDFALMSGAASGLDGFLLGEWMKRDFDAALAWYEKLESRSAKSRLAVQLCIFWPKEQAEQGFAFHQANRELFDAAVGAPLLTNAFDRMAEKGPAALEKLLRVIREDGVGLKFENPVRFPEGFDFSTLVRGDEFKAVWDRGNADFLIKAWYAQDREKAFNWLVENHGAKSLGTITTFHGGDVLQDLQWMGGKFEGLDAEQRADFTGDLEQRWIMNPSDFATFIQAIKDPSVLDEARTMGVQTLFAGNGAHFMPMLEAIEDPARRIKLLEHAEPAAFFSLRPDLRRFDAASETLLRRNLAEWNATDGQIDTIISRFKP